MKRHSNFARVQAAWSDDSTRAAITLLLRQLADGPEGAIPGPEELLEALESHPGASRAAVVDYFAYRPPATG